MSGGTLHFFAMQLQLLGFPQEIRTPRTLTLDEHLLVLFTDVPAGAVSLFVRNDVQRRVVLLLEDRCLAVFQ